MKTILVVDDDKPTLELMEKFLSENLGYHVITLNNSLEVIETIKNNTIDMAFMDNMMPEKSGLELLSEIKDHGYEFPIIMITAHHSLKIAISALKEGAYDYIKKPLEFKEITGLIEKSIGLPEKESPDPDPEPTESDIEEKPDTTVEPEKAEASEPAPKPESGLKFMDEEMDDLLVNFETEVEDSEQPKVPSETEDELEDIDKEELFATGYTYFKRKNYKKARIFWEKLLEYEPNNTTVKHNLSVLEKKEKEGDKRFDINF
jgi:CheY-like chemotaxis protein